MEIKYSLTEDDLIKWTHHHNNNSPSVKRMMLKYRLAPAVVFLALGYFLASTVDVTYGALTGVIGSIMWILLAPRNWRQLTEMRVRKTFREGPSPAVMEERVVSIEPEGVRSKSRLADGFYKWDAITRVDKSEDHIFLYISPVNAVVIPTRAFANADERHRFLETVVQYRERAAGLTNENSAT